MTSSKTVTGLLQFYQIVLLDLSVSVRVRLEGGGVHDAFVKDESIAFVLESHFQLFGGRVSGEVVGVPHMDPAAFIERMLVVSF